LQRAVTTTTACQKSINHKQQRRNNDVDHAKNQITVNDIF
jgi:hypothetical protein